MIALALAVGLAVSPTTSDYLKVSADAAVYASRCPAGYRPVFREMSVAILGEVLGSRDRAVLIFAENVRPPVDGLFFDDAACLLGLTEIRERSEVERARWRASRGP